MANWTSPRHRAARASMLIVLSAATATAAGCGCYGGGQPVEHTYAYCGHAGGSVTISGPADRAVAIVGGRFNLSDAGNCLSDDGTCSLSPRFSLSSDYAPDQHQLEVSVELPPSGGAATYALPNPIVLVAATLWTSPATPPLRLAVVAGRIDVDQSDASALRATFAIDVETPSGQRFTVRDGTVEVSGCETKSYDSCDGSGSGDFD